VRSLSTDLQAHLAGDAHTIAIMLRLDLVNGDVLAFTDHDAELAYDLGDGEVAYQPWTGISPSDVVLVTGFDVSNFEVTGPIGDVVTRAAVLGGKYRKAKARLFFVNWADLTQGAGKIMQGRVAASRVEGSRFIFEVRNALDILNQSKGRVLSPYCSAIFGDSSTGCPVVRTAHPCEVTAVTDAFRFTVDLGGTHADDFFNFGSVAFLTGDLTGIEEAKVFDYTGASGAVELYEPLVEAPQVGDTLNLYRGCSKLLKSDDVAVPTCATWGAVEDFRGWPECPSSRFYMKVNAPGTSYE
jgi:uncharacterized phage protein (TIGR02218 family)